MNPQYLRSLRDKLAVKLAARTDPPGKYLDRDLLEAVVELCDQVQQVEEALNQPEKRKSNPSVPGTSSAAGGARS